MGRFTQPNPRVRCLCAVNEPKGWCRLTCQTDTAADPLFRQAGMDLDEGVNPLAALSSICHRHAWGRGRMTRIVTPMA